MFGLFVILPVAGLTLPCATDDGQAFAEGTVAEMLLASMGGTAASRDLLSSLCCPITKVLCSINTSTCH